jgi:hypothetical protein
MNADSQPPSDGKERDDLSSSRKDFVGEHVSGILDRLWTAVLSRVPLGYQDETGFHFGASRRRTAAA